MKRWGSFFFLLSTVSAAKVCAPALDFRLAGIDENPQSLCAYEGKVLLVVNTASRCGYASQMEGLKNLHRRFAPQGFEILAFPSNNFGSQEPENDAGIKSLYQQRWAPDFPIFAKSDVVGARINPFFRFLTENTTVKRSLEWNFAKFLLNRKGDVAARYEPQVEPSELSPKIAELLGEKI